MTLRGLADRWLAGEEIAEIEFALRDPVSMTAGPYTGKDGSIVLLVGVRPEPTYLVELGSGRGEVRIRQSDPRSLA